MLELIMHSDKTLKPARSNLVYGENGKHAYFHISDQFMRGAVCFFVHDVLTGATASFECECLYYKDGTDEEEAMRRPRYSLYKTVKPINANITTGSARYIVWLGLSWKTLNEDYDEETEEYFYDGTCDLEVIKSEPCEITISQTPDSKISGKGLELIVQWNLRLDDVKGYCEASKAYKESAQGYAEAAEKSKAAAQTSETKAKEYSDAANEVKKEVVAAKEATVTASEAATGAAVSAGGSATLASKYAQNSDERAAAAKLAEEEAKKAAELSKQNVFEHSWDGTVLTVKSATGESSADLKGDEGAKGIRGESGQPRVVSEAIATGTVSVELENNTEYRFSTPLTSLTINKIVRGESLTNGYVDIEYIAFFPDKESATAFDITQYTGGSEYVYIADRLKELLDSGYIRGKNMALETHIEEDREYLRAIPTRNKSSAIELTLPINNSREYAAVAVIGAKSNVIAANSNTVGTVATVGLPKDENFDFTKEFLRVDSPWTEKTDGVSRTKHIFDMSRELSSGVIEEYRYFKIYPWDGKEILIDNGLSEQWCVIFTAAKSGISVAFPDETDIIWAVTEPTFTAGYTYYLSFIPFGDKLIGVWASKELT